MTHTFKRLFAILSLTVMVTIFAAVATAQESATTPAPSPTTLEISPASPDVTVGQKVKFTE